MPLKNKRNLLRRTVLPALVLLVLFAWQYYNEHRPFPDGGEPVTTGVVESAYAAQRSGVWVEINGRIQRVLEDDHEGSRHQRFVLELDSGHTVLIAHNIDLAERIPVSMGKTVELRGRYEWNERGGVIHWTHHDPGGKESGGWIRAGGNTYR